MIRDGMPVRPGWDDYFMAIARVVATRADCTRKQVGCVLVDQERRIVATGYNGAPAGHPGCLTDGACPRGRLRGPVDVASDTGRPGTAAYCVAVHAELNALVHAVRSARGGTAYVTHTPCENCRKALVAAGVSRIVVP